MLGARLNSMFSRYRLPVRTTGALIGAFLLGLASSQYMPFDVGSVINRQAPDATAKDQKAHNLSAPVDALDWVKGVKQEGPKSSDSSENDVKKGENYHNALDLEAQWAAALAGERMARLTVWQIIFGAIGIGALVYSLALNREATGAAITAANAAIAVERAFLYVTIHSHNFGNIGNESFYDKSPELTLNGKRLVDYYFRNYGKTPAIIREVSHGITVSLTPPIPVYTVAPELEGQVVETGGATHPLICEEQTSVVTVGDALKVAKGETYFWFFGKVEYIDVFGAPRTHRFLFRYARLGKRFRFQPYDYKHYNQST